MAFAAVVGLSGTASNARCRVALLLFLRPREHEAAAEGNEDEEAKQQQQQTTTAVANRR